MSDTRNTMILMADDDADDRLLARDAFHECQLDRELEFVENGEELMDYPHARVRLHFCKVYAWTGEFQMREGQSMAWETLPVCSGPLLPGTIPVLRWFAAERGYTGATHAD